MTLAAFFDAVAAARSAETAARTSLIVFGTILPARDATFNPEPVPKDTKLVGSMTIE